MDIKDVSNIAKDRHRDITYSDSDHTALLYMCSVTSEIT